MQFIPLLLINSKRCYNNRSAEQTSPQANQGADFKLDVGLYRLDQQVACQREAYHIVSFECESGHFLWQKGSI